MIDNVPRAIEALANAITPMGVMAGKDAMDGTVASLTEAVMGITGALLEIANAIDHLAVAVRERD